MGIVFVGGVYAVGKTTACEQAAREAGVAHATASQLIKSEKADAISDGGKSVLDVVDNQRLLIRAITRLRQVESRGIILDGHFTIPNTQGGTDSVHFDVFREMGVTGSVVYGDDPLATCGKRRRTPHKGRDCRASGGGDPAGASRRRSARYTAANSQRVRQR